MNNISFIVKIHNETKNLQEILDKLKEIIVQGDEVIMHIEPLSVTNENLIIINQYEFIKKSKSKIVEKIMIHITKVFNSIDSNIENKCTNSIIYHIDSNIDENQIKLLRQ